MATDSDQAREFGERLRTAMHAKGKTSARNRSGVDVAALAKGVGVSYEMARRYAEGAAIPRPDVLNQIAAWLSVPAEALAWGTVREGEVDPIALEQCLRAVAAAQEVAGVTLSNDEAARIVAQLYQEVRRGEALSQSTLAAMLRAMTTK